MADRELRFEGCTTTSGTLLSKVLEIYYWNMSSHNNLRNLKRLTKSSECMKHTSTVFSVTHTLFYSETSLAMEASLWLRCYHSKCVPEIPDSLLGM